MRKAQRSASNPPDPAKLRPALLRWFRRHRRDLPWRRTRDPYAIWVSEAMLQQTRVATALRYYGRFLEEFPDVRTLAEASEDEVLAAWSGLGYYRRAYGLIAGARAVMERHGGRVPADLDALRALPGIGRYTAGAIASLAFGLRVPAVDGNARRVLARILGRRGTDGAEEEALWELAARLVRREEPGEMNQALMELGALVCTPRSPRCPACPAARWCLARISGSPGAFPRPRRRPRPVTVRVAAAVVRNRGRVLLVPRRERGPFHGGWDVPAVEVTEGESPRRALAALMASRHGLPVNVAHEAERFTHGIQNRRLAIEAYACRPARDASGDGDELRWIDAAALDGVPVSGATRKILGQNRSQGGTQSRSLSSRPPGGSGSGSSGRRKR